VTGYRRHSNLYFVDLAIGKVVLDQSLPVTLLRFAVALRGRFRHLAQAPRCSLEVRLCRRYGRCA
jgi:hypothetical protein